MQIRSKYDNCIVNVALPVIKKKGKKTSCDLESQLPHFARDYSISFRIASQLLDYVRSRLARPSQCSRIVLLGFDSRPCPVGIEIQQSLVIDLLTWCLAELSLGLSHTGHSRRQIADVALEPGARCNEDAHYCTLKTHNRPQPRQREHFYRGAGMCRVRKAARKIDHTCYILYDRLIEINHMPFNGLRD